MPSSSKKPKYPNKSEANRRRWADPEYKARVAKKIGESKKKWCAEHRNDPAYIEHQKKASAARHKKYDNNKAYKKRLGKAISKAVNNPKELARRREAALKNPYFNGERNGELHTKDKWTDEHREKVSKRITKYNKSKAGKKMASKRSKKTLSDAATKQRWMDGKEAWYAEHPEVRVEHAKKHLQPHNDERHRLAEQRKSIRWWREAYKNGQKPIVKPLPDQPQEYYDELDEFFAEGL